MPGRGKGTSLLLAVVTIVLVLLSGALVLYVYEQATADSPEATTPEETQIRRPLVDLSE